jgi:hypothetical protein
MVMVVMVGFLGLLTTLGLPRLLHVLLHCRKGLLGSLEITVPKGAAKCVKVIIQLAICPSLLSTCHSLLTILRLADVLHVRLQRRKGVLGI